MTTSRLLFGCGPSGAEACGCRHITQQNQGIMYSEFTQTCRCRSHASHLAVLHHSDKERARGDKAMWASDGAGGVGEWCPRSGELRVRYAFDIVFDAASNNEQVMHVYY
jgi:hypothetical protein